MQFNTQSDSQSIVDEILSITKSTLGKYPIKSIARRVNLALDRYLEIATSVAGKGVVDDINQATPPILQQNLVSGTNKYIISGSFAGTYSGSFFNIIKMEALNSGGIGQILTPESIDLIQDAFSTLYSTATTGTPSNYLRLGNYVYIRPTPNYNSTNGLVVYGERTFSYFASTDTTKTPGIPVPHHLFLCHYAAQPYLEENSMSNAQNNYQHILEDETEIRKYYFRIDKGLSNRIKANIENNR